MYNSWAGNKVIVRATTGVYFGTLVRRESKELCLSNARRLITWKTKKSLSLNAVATHGVQHNHSQISDPVNLWWGFAEEMFSMTDKAINSLETAPVAERETAKIMGNSKK